LAQEAGAYFLSELLLPLRRPALLILPGRKEANRFLSDLRFFMAEAEQARGDGRIGEFLPYDMSPLTGLSPNREVIRRRLASLYALTNEKYPIVVTCPEALSYRILPKDVFVGALDYLAAGEELDRDLLIGRLEESGYVRTSLVEEVGDYAVRGGVMDIFSPLYSMPLRVEFWDQRVESIRFFDPMSQRSLDHVKEMVIVPATEIIQGETQRRRARSMGRLPLRAEGGMGFPGQEAWLNHFYDRLNSIFDYLPKDALVINMAPHRLKDICDRVSQRFHSDLERCRQEAAKKRSPFPDTEGLILGYSEMMERLSAHQVLETSEADIAPPGVHVVRIPPDFEKDFDLQLRSPEGVRVSMAPLAQKIEAWTAGGLRVVVVTRTEQQASRIQDILSNYGVEAVAVVEGWRSVPPVAGLVICVGRLSKGFKWQEIGLCLVSEDEIFGPKAARARPGPGTGHPAINWSSFSQLKTGDLMVHEEHGIGRYAGLMTMQIDGKTNDFLVIEYAAGGKLYIPADRISVLQKYAGADEGEPKLDQLGGRSWNIAKQKARGSVRKIAQQLVEIYALRRHRTGFQFSPPDPYFREFEAAFEHEETPDQIKAIEDVLSDMMSERPMDRLVCGDVGYGKTEVAVRSSFKAVMDGKQVAVLVPTTVLAEQHYDTFRRRMEPYSVKVGILSRFKSRKEQLDTIAQIRSGRIDIVIGTHRLLQKDVEFKDLGLVIIDEEQRFGVKQKEALKRFRAMVDVLALTATPIPRTFQMSLMGIRDLSVIETPPEERQAIETYLSPYDETLIDRAIRFEVERKGQVFFVHNKVHTINAMVERLSALVPSARFAAAHGQMKECELEETMMRFLRREIDVLVCSTIIESGLDIPSANTIIINEADRFGLAQIYQLRGRVGRSKEKAYAYLLVSDGAQLTRDAEKRLKALMDFTRLGAGVHLAMHDLKIRGGGNILGFAQAGHITAVGYELYVKLIEQAVAELKGEEWEEEINPEILLRISAYLPESYVADTDMRLNLYRRLSTVKDDSDLQDLLDEIRDRFGPPPLQAANLMKVMAIRLCLKRLGATKLEASKDRLRITLRPAGQSPRTRAGGDEQAGLSPDRLVQMLQKGFKGYRLLPGGILEIITLNKDYENDVSEVEKAVRLLEKNACFLA
jgi:transcription-repair coupling factor (superfamily II helicase)